MPSEGQFVLNGISFGGPTDAVLIDSADFGSPAVRATDSNRPNESGALFGRDHLGTAVWTFNVFTATATDAASAYSAIRPLLNEWRKYLDKVNSPGYTWLNFRVGGRDLRVYGRPRRLEGPDYNHSSVKQGVTRASLQFELADPVIYSANVTSRTHTLTSMTEADAIDYLEANDAPPYVKLPGAPTINRGVTASAINLSPSASIPFTVSVKVNSGTLEYLTIFVNDSLVTYSSVIMSSGNEAVWDSRNHTFKLDGVNEHWNLIGHSTLRASMKAGGNPILICGRATGNVTATISYSRGDYSF